MGFGRADVRLDLDMVVKVSTFYDEEGLILPAVEEQEMILTNLSATGINVTCQRDLNVKQSFVLELTLGDEHVRLMPVIVRKEKLEGKLWSYGCKLMHLDNKEEQIIRGYIFNAQLYKRKIDYKKALSKD